MNGIWPTCALPHPELSCHRLLPTHPVHVAAGEQWKLASVQWNRCLLAVQKRNGENSDDTYIRYVVHDLEAFSFKKLNKKVKSPEHLHVWNTASLP